jgi:hypothetical protein
VTDTEIGDGYHTLDDLYQWRALYSALLFSDWAYFDAYDVHKSRRHHDGELCFGGDYFIVMAELPTGQISHHYPMREWDRFYVPERERAAKWDGHTAEQARARLAEFVDSVTPSGSTSCLMEE